MYRIYLNNKEIETDKYLIVLSDRYCSSVTGVLDTEQDLAHYVFVNKFYKQPLPSNLDTSGAITIYNPNGKRINATELDEIIEKYFPEETAAITARKEGDKKVGFKHFISLGLVSGWMEKQDKIINDLSQTTKQRIAEIRKKSKHYVDTLFPEAHPDNRMKRISDR